MEHLTDGNLFQADEFAKLGNNTIAYVREMTASEIDRMFPDELKLEGQETYWALFAADGEPLMLADQQQPILKEAFFNDLQALLPN